MLEFFFSFCSVMNKYSSFPCCSLTILLSSFVSRLFLQIIPKFVFSFWYFSISLSVYGLLPPVVIEMSAVVTWCLGVHFVVYSGDVRPGLPYLKHVTKCTFLWLAFLSCWLVFNRDSSSNKRFYTKSTSIFFYFALIVSIAVTTSENSLGNAINNCVNLCYQTFLEYYPIGCSRNSVSCSATLCEDEVLRIPPNMLNLFTSALYIFCRYFSMR